MKRMAVIIYLCFVENGNDPNQEDILAEVRALAVEYHALTGKPLDVTGEIGEFEASEIMGLNLSAATIRRYKNRGLYTIVP